HRLLEVAVAMAGELLLDGLKALAGGHGVDLHQVGHTGLVGRVKADAGLGVRHGLLELAQDVLRLFQHVDAAVGVLVGFAHLLFRAGEAHDPGAHLWDIGIRQLKGITVDPVEPGGDVPADLHVLLLVAAHRHQVCLVQQDVGGHQGRIGEEAGV
ncbi:DNA-directed RNA polymerase specialized sigma subunit, sigma24 family, partial [Dysosmobacter welbionis]